MIAYNPNGDGGVVSAGFAITLCTVYEQYMYSIWTVYVQYMNSIWTVYEQYMYSICTVYEQYMNSICTVYVQYMNSIWTHTSAQVMLSVFYILISILYILFKTAHFKFVNCFDVLRNTLIPFTEHLPEDSHNTWPKHVGG